MVAMSSSLLFAWSIGGIIGPTAAATTMEFLGPGGLFIYTATVATLFIAFVLYRIRERIAVPTEGRERFVTLPQPGPLTSEMDPRMSKEAVEKAMDTLKKSQGADEENSEDAALDEEEPAKT